MIFFYILLDDITISILLEHMNLDIYDIKSHEFSTWVAPSSSATLLLVGKGSLLGGYEDDEGTLR